MEATSICGEWHWMVRMSVDWRWLECTMSAVSLCVVSSCCCISEDTLQTLDNEMELIDRSVLLKSIIIVTSERRLCNARRLSVCLSVYLSVCLYVCLSICLSVCLSETLDNDLELIEWSVLFKSVIIVISASRLLMAGVCLSVCPSVCLAVLAILNVKTILNGSFWNCRPRCICGQRRTDQRLLPYPDPGIFGRILPHF